jgi:class 3 adenylate cyclase
MGNSIEVKEIVSNEEERKEQQKKFFLAAFFEYMSRKIKAKVIVFEIIIILLVAIPIGTIITMNMENVLIQKTHQMSQKIVSDLAKTIAMNFDSRAMTHDAINSLKDTEGIIYLGYSGILTALLEKVHLYIGNSPATNWLESAAEKYKDLHGFYLNPATQTFTNDQKITPGFEYVMPVCIEELNNMQIGIIVLRFSKELIDGEIGKVRGLITIITGAIIIIGIAVSFRGANSIVKPILKLTNMVKRFGDGDLHARIELPYKDEIGILANTFNEMVLSIREKLEMQKFVSSSTVKMIQTSVSQNDVGKTKRVEVSLLFSDIRGFTSLSETLDPQEVVDMLNLFLDVQTQIIRKFDGDIDKFVGDEIVAVFDGNQKCQRAVAASRAIQKTLTKINKDRLEKGLFSVHVGIGVNNGIVVRGSIGSHDRKDYTVIGDNVNLTARLCSAAAKDDIMISRAVYDLLPNKHGITKLEAIMVKGKTKPVEVYKVDY